MCRLFEGAPGHRDQTFHKADQQALCSLISFNLGAFIGRIGDKVGAHKRIWLIAGTFIQALFTMAAAISFWKSGQGSIADERDDPAWTNLRTFVGLAFMSAALGVQGILGKRLNTQFGTTSACHPFFFFYEQGADGAVPQSCSPLSGSSSCRTLAYSACANVS